MGASSAGAGATASSLAIRQPSARRRISTKRRYVPPSAMSWSCVPRCATVPPSTTRIWSDASTVASRFSELFRRETGLLPSEYRRGLER